MAAPMTPEFFPRGTFYCLLDDQPDFLVPQHLIPAPVQAGPLIVNPLCCFAWQAPLPPDMALRAGDRAGLFDIPWTIWVDDPATRAVLPFWLGPDFAHALHDLTPGEPFTADMSQEAVQTLITAQVLVTPDHAARRRRQWMDAVQHYAMLFQRGYVMLQGLLHPFHLGALRRYYRYQTRAGAFPLGDGQTTGRYVAHDESVTRFFHRQLTHVIGDIARNLVQPSYTYLSFYQGGADLAPHTDRAQCEYTASLCVDATPEPEAQVPWPLHIMTAEGELRVWQHIGDALLFRGRVLTHWREWLADGYTCSNVLLHYVDQDFAGPLG
jgi:hypothetical protein